MKYALKTVELAVTNACTHRCPYCYVGTPETKKHGDYGTLCSIIDVLERNHVETVTLVGGDPAEHPEIFNFIKYIKNNSNMDLSIMSNTMNISAPIPEVAQYVDGIDFTLHGISAREHDDFCGRGGAYAQMVSKLQQYSTFGVGINIAINIIPQTYDKIYEMLGALIKKDLAIDTVFLQRILPLGRAEKTEKYNVKTSQINIALSQVSKAEKEFGINISVEDPFPLCCIDKEFHRYMRGCPEGKTRMPIDESGNISCCGAVGDKSIGNILLDSFEDVWDKSPVFNKFRSNSYISNPKCESCDLINVCGGGCPVSCELCNSRGIDFIKKFED